QKAMNARGRIQILPANHTGDSLDRVIDDHGEVIARRGFFARHHDVAPKGWLRPDLPALAARPGLGPGKRSGPFDRSLHVEPKHVGLARVQAAPAFGSRNALGRTGIERDTFRVTKPNALSFAFGHHSGDLGPRFECRIDEALAVEPQESCAIV